MREKITPASLKAATIPYLVSSIPLFNPSASFKHGSFVYGVFGAIMSNPGVMLWLQMWSKSIPKSLGTLHSNSHLTASFYVTIDDKILATICVLSTERSSSEAIRTVLWSPVLNLLTKTMMKNVNINPSDEMLSYSWSLITTEC